MEKGVLNENGYLDVLTYYSQVSKVLQNFLKGKEIATKIWLKDIVFLKRGSKDKPLFIKDLLSVDNKMNQLRKFDLETASSKLSEKQHLVWEYFVPHKMCDFLYATNNESPGKPIERIFIDVDRGKGITSEHAQEVTKLIVEEIKKDEKLKKLIKFKIFIMWTGSSFHIYLMLNKAIPNSAYEKYFSFSKKKPLESFIGRWASIVQKKVKFNVSGGHEKILKGINIDPSQTPSGKLARAPFSLHVKSFNEFDGIALPVSEKSLYDKRLVQKLKSYTPERVLNDIIKLSKLLP